MSHFLARLVDRARGTAPRVEPIIAPRFAPVPVTEIAAESEAPAPVPSRKNETGLRNQALTPKIVRQEIESPRAKEARREETAAAPDQEKLLVPQEIPVSNPTALIVRRIGPEGVAVPPKANGARARQAMPQAPTTRPGSPIPATVRAVVAGITDPGHPSAMPAIRRALTQPNDSHSEPPIVRVTIGRIEVRAETPSAPPPRKTPSPSRPKLTLDTYLKERKEGRR